MEKLNLVIMMKKWAIIIIIVFVGLGFFTGVKLYELNKNSNMKKEAEKTNEKTEDDSIKKEKTNNLEVVNSNKKTTPNCTIILKVYYEECGHLVETRKKIEEIEVNMTEEEIKERFKEWEIQRFNRYGDCFI